MDDCEVQSINPMDNSMGLAPLASVPIRAYRLAVLKKAVTVVNLLNLGSGS
ncbi:MAG: hypothetical protein MK137_03350 [Rickettsiales bacterium]|nr:hypothetical protein [Rickettsiales bacterium]